MAKRSNPVVERIIKTYTEWHAPRFFGRLASRPRSVATHGAMVSAARALLNRALTHGYTITKSGDDSVEMALRRAHAAYDVYRLPNAHTTITAWREVCALINTDPELALSVGAAPTPFDFIRHPEGVPYDGTMTAAAIRLAMTYMAPHTLANLRLKTALTHWDSFPEPLQRALRHLMWWTWKDRPGRENPPSRNFDTVHLMANRPCGYGGAAARCTEEIRTTILADVAMVPDTTVLICAPHDQPLFVMSDYYTPGTEHLLRIPEHFWTDEANMTPQPEVLEAAWGRANRRAKGSVAQREAEHAGYLPAPPRDREGNGYSGDTLRLRRRKTPQAEQGTWKLQVDLSSTMCDAEEYDLGLPQAVAVSTAAAPDGFEAPEIPA